MAKKAVFFRQNEVDIDEFARQFSEIKADQDDVFSVENGDKADFQDQTEFWRESESLKVQDDLFNHMAKFSKLFLSRIHERSGAVTEEKLGDTALTLSDVIDIGRDKIAVEDMVRLFERDVVRAQEADLAKPTFMALVPGSGHLLYSAAEYLASIAHIQCAARFTSSSACDIEESVVRWVAGIVGYPDECRGVLVSGSSMGVILAFSTARDYRLHGAHLFESAVVYMTEQAHLCNDRSLRVVGLGSCVYRCVPSLKHRMDPQQLDAMITKDKELGLTPFLIIATLGVTGTGAVDPFAEISEVAKKHDVWLHADAAIGGFLLLDEEIKERHKAVSLSDSITLDFHKAMSAPYGTAVVLVRDGVKLKTAMARGTAAYINNPGKWSEYAPIELSFEFTRPFRSFPIWFALKVLGTEPIKKQMTEKLQLTRYAYEVLSSNPHIQVYMEPDLCVLAFRTNFQNLRLSNLSTRKWHDLIVEEGAFYVSQTMAEGFFHNRMCILSFRTHIEAVDTALASVQRTLDLLQKRYPLFSTKSTKGLKSFRRFKSYDEGIVVTPLRDKKFFKSIAE